MTNHMITSYYICLFIPIGILVTVFYLVYRVQLYYLRNSTFGFVKKRFISSDRHHLFIPSIANSPVGMHIFIFRRVRGKYL